MAGPPQAVTRHLPGGCVHRILLTDEEIKSVNLESTKTIDIGRFVPVDDIVLSTREGLLALESRGKGIMAYSLRKQDEVPPSDEIFESIVNAKHNAGMIAIAEKIVRQQEGKFDPSQFIDRYEKARKELIAEKQKGHRQVAASEPEETDVVDLMAASRARLEASGRAPRNAAKAKPDKGGAPAKPKARRPGWIGRRVSGGAIFLRVAEPAACGLHF